MNAELIGKYIGSVFGVFTKSFTWGSGLALGAIWGLRYMGIEV
jgi:hypothetical protein